MSGRAYQRDGDLSLYRKKVNLTKQWCELPSCSSDVGNMLKIDDTLVRTPAFDGALIPYIPLRCICANGVVEAYTKTRLGEQHNTSSKTSENPLANTSHCCQRG